MANQSLSISNRSDGPAMDIIAEDPQIVPQLADVLSCISGIAVSSGTSIRLSPDPLPDIRMGIKATPTFEQIMEFAQEDAIESNVEQQQGSSPSPLHAGAHSPMNAHDDLVQAIKDSLVDRSIEELVAYLRGLRGKRTPDIDLATMIIDTATSNDELASPNNDMEARIIQLQKSLDGLQEQSKRFHKKTEHQLQRIQGRVEALLTQTYELHEYPIPRLFIVLPQDSSSWNPVNLLSNRFRLYFLCECGKHTKSTNNRVPHIHLAKHEGYDITRPKEFFRQYGSYVLTILRMLKLGISAAGIAIPALALLIREDTINKATSSLKMLVGNIQAGMDQVIGCIENVCATEGVVDGHSDQMEINEALEGADLRQLETFLKNKDANRVLGNLYRTVTDEGHVKWVCIDHYRANYQEKSVKTFRNAVKSLGGSFDENIGRVEVRLPSKVQARQFYQELVKARSVYELSIELGWTTARGDFKKLRNTLVQTNVAVLDIILNNLDGPFTDIWNRRQRYDPIFDIMRHPSIQSFTTDGPSKFIKRSTLKSRSDDFPNLRHLNIDLRHLKDDIPGLKCLVVKAPSLSSLILQRDDQSFLRVYNAIAEYQTYPVTFPDRPLRILQPMDTSAQSTDDIKDMADLLKVLGGRIEIVELSGNVLDDSTVAGFAKAVEDGSRLKELILERACRNLRERCIRDIASIVTRSHLRKLDIHLECDEGRVHILESIQWEHLRDLAIRMTTGIQEKRVMRALVNGAKKMSGRIELDEFSIHSEDDRNDFSSISQYGLLSEFLSSTSLRKLWLEAHMSEEQVFSILTSGDLSRMQGLRLLTQGFDSAGVNAILDCIEHATELQHIHLRYATVTDEQKERMKAKGIQLVDQ